MKYAPLIVLLMAGCSQTATQQAATVATGLNTIPGQLFCSFQTAGGGQLAVALIDAYASAKTLGVGAPAAVIATGMAQAEVNALCAQAAASAGATAGVAISPPAAPVPSVAVVVPAK